MSKKPLKKIGQVKLTDEQKELIAANIDSPFFKLISQIIVPSRVNQISITCVSAAQTNEDLWFYKGRVAEADWLPKYLFEQIAKIDKTDYSNSDDDEISAEDDTVD